MNKRTDVVKGGSNDGGSRRALRAMLHPVRWDYSSEDWWLDNDDTGTADERERRRPQLVIAIPICCSHTPHYRTTSLNRSHSCTATVWQPSSAFESSRLRRPIRGQARWVKLDTAAAGHENVVLGAARLSRECGIGLIPQAFVIMRGEKSRDVLDHVHQAQEALL